MNLEMETWLRGKIHESLARAGTVEVEDLGELPWSGTFAVWHPLDDLHEAPVVKLEGRAKARAIVVGGELAGYVFSRPGDVASWTDLGDASTDADRLFLVQHDQFEAVIDWMREGIDEFEELGGDRRLEVAERGETQVVILQSADGNAKIQGGLDGAGQLVCALLFT